MDRDNERYWWEMSTQVIKFSIPTSLLSQTQIEEVSLPINLRQKIGYPYITVPTDVDFVLSFDVLSCDIYHKKRTEK